MPERGGAPGAQGGEPLKAGDLALDPGQDVLTDAVLKEGHEA